MSGPYEAFEVTVIKVADNAVLLDFEIEEERLWIPFSQIEDNGEDLDEGWQGEVFITEWIAQKKGLL